MKKILNMIACLAVVLGLAACNPDFLETSPTSSYAEDFVLSSVDNLEAALNGTHKSMVAQYLSRQNIGGYPSFQIAMDCLGECILQAQSQSTPHAFTMLAQTTRPARNLAISMK